ncbi:MAG: Uncharacterized protein FD131_3427 [Rhodocyclaceae bacterium]|nr:MAG: Uncharacterized protein FD131_3427 [Rhodocyclaceae bacterium]
MNATSTNTMPGNSTNTDSTTYPLDTAQFAAINRVKAGSVRHRLCISGSYFGVSPKKLRNGRLAWPDVLVEA